jgi:Tfp pilus assembly PilM family ATPase
MEIRVESEANQYIPFSLDEVSLDFSEPEKHSVATGTAVDARRDAVACDGQARLRG